MSKYLLLILGMSIVTYIPRLLPFLFIDKSFSKKFERFLLYIPPTALGALIIPGAFEAIPNMPLISIIGLGFALLYSWFRGGLIVSVLGSILVVFIGIYIKGGLI